jgi:hypothetical protein
VLRVSDAKDTEQTGNVRQELLRRLTDCMKVREIKLQENGLFARLVFELRDRLVRFLGASRRKVNLRIVR